MLCSPKELGLSEDAQGLLILREDSKPGQPFAAYLGRSGSDVVYDLEVTPNRPDLSSVLGIAREVAAVSGNRLRIPETGIAAGAVAIAGAAPGTGIDHYVAVRIEDPDLCPRYTARVLQGVKVGPSPEWLRATLEKVGIRSISNVVDVTNYVMLETGQPLHAFDYHLIAGGRSGDGTLRRFQLSRGEQHTTIVIRRAARRKFVTLDGQERTLTGDVLLIADEQKAIGIAGVMGGKTARSTKTPWMCSSRALASILRIWRTSKHLDLRTDASNRFERGADIGIGDYASQRAAQLILQTAGGHMFPASSTASQTTRSETNQVAACANGLAPGH
jgi:phenylalanyl-tRNA synthetase beta chain